MIDANRESSLSIGPNCIECKLREMAVLKLNDHQLYTCKLLEDTWYDLKKSNARCISCKQTKEKALETVGCLESNAVSSVLDPLDLVTEENDHCK
ncbi:MAG TPA: hypothetical protein VH796_01775 [Nitrososphaeraceae archaeon]|jgi:transposase-like protein